MPFAPEEYANASSYDLLAAASLGHIAFDHRLLHALLDETSKTLPGILKFAAEDRSGDRVDLSVELVSLFAACPSPEAVPFLVSEILRFPDDIPDQMSEALIRIGVPAIEPILALNLKTPEIGFLLATLGVADARIEAYMAEIAAQDPEEGKFLRDLYEDHTGPSGKPPEPYNIWEDFEEVVWPDLALLTAEEIAEFLSSPSAELRTLALQTLQGGDLSPTLETRVLATARKDPDAEVRGAAWETLGLSSLDDRVFEEMYARIGEPGMPQIERAGLAIALAPDLERPGVRSLLESIYEDPSTRAKGLAAIWRSLDRGFETIVVRHLDDPDPDIRKEAIAGVGYLRLLDHLGRLEEMFLDEEFRLDALYAYALAAPARETKPDLDRLALRIGDLAKGLSEADEEVVATAFEIRLEAAQMDKPEPVRNLKIGRNEPCPCGSGKKYKKCCGA